MKVATLIEDVLDAIEDDSFSNARILSYIEKACSEVAAKFSLPDLLVESELVVGPGIRTIAMPDNYMKGLFHAVVVLPRTADIVIEKSFARLVELTNGFTKSAGRSSLCTVSTRLHLSPDFLDFPDGSTIRLFYYSKPPAILENSFISFIPEEAQYDLLFNSACASCYNLIETGIDSPKINHNKYLGFYTAALEKLAAIVGLPEETPDFIPVTPVVRFEHY